MLSKNLYRRKKKASPNRRKQLIYAGIIIFCGVILVLGVIKYNSLKPESGQKIEDTVQTGDQPVTKDLEVYVNADGGLSLRQDRDTSSDRLVLIPNGTKLTVTQELEGWYKVNYDGKEGWVSKDYTTIKAPVTDETKDWATFTGVGYKIKYQPGWYVQDYGANETAGMKSVVAFSNQSLPSSIPSGSDFIAPVVVNVSKETLETTNKTYSAMSGVTVEALTIAGKAAQKYTSTSPTSNTQVSTIVMAGGNGTLIFSEAGGYLDDLLKMLNTLTIG